MGNLLSPFLQKDKSAVTEDTNSTTRLGFAMFLGATITLFWVPDSFDKDGKSMSLETLSKGPRVLEGYRGSRWNTWHTKDIPRSDTSRDV